MKNCVFIASSLDGFIADRDGGLDWLQSVPNPDLIDMGYVEFMANIDAIIMGRTTFETVCSFDVDWPYDKPVFVLSNTLNELPKEYESKVKLVKGPLEIILGSIHKEGYNQLYIDGGTTIQNFLKEDLIDELIITTMPILLGGGFPLFGELSKEMKFELLDSKVFLNQIIQSHYIRKRL